MPDYRPVWYQSADGLNLFAREYARADSPFTLLCMHGLTRNAADFDEFCQLFSPDFHILVADQRGRGLSDYDPQPERYQIPVYAEDMHTLLDDRSVDRVVLVGTSMGGLIAMQMLAQGRATILGTVLNDIGAQVEAEGLARIQRYAGMDDGTARDWSEAVAQTRAINQVALPDFRDSDWQHFARKLYREEDNGRLKRAYDPAIFAAQAPGPAEVMSLWPLYDSLDRVPMLVVRGAHSDILSRQCVDEMQARRPEVEAVEIPNRGHAPMLDEPEAVVAIRGFLDRLAGG